MEKIAADVQLDVASTRRIAKFALATALSSPVIGLDPEKTKKAAAVFGANMEKCAERHNELVDMISNHVRTFKKTA